MIKTSNTGLSFYIKKGISLLCGELWSGGDKMYSSEITKTFTGLQMFKFAELMEEEGYNFYINGARDTTGETKEFFLFAARQEFIHKKRFAELSIQLENILKTETVFTFNTEVSKYLAGLIKNRVFNKKEKTNDSVKDLKSALAWSLKYEMISLNIYTQMYETVSQNDIKIILSIIIKEEKIHVSYLSKRLHKMVGKILI